MTKADRLRKARRVRRHVSLYLVFQKPHVRAGHADADDIAYMCLVDARAELDALLEIEQARRRLRGAERADAALRGTDRAQN